MAVESLLEALQARPEMAWMAEAKCLGLGTPSAPPKDEDKTKAIVWYPERSNAAVQRSKSVCKGLNEDYPGECPVIGQCLEWALANDEFGVWGGTSERERRKIRKVRRTTVVVMKVRSA